MNAEAKYFVADTDMRHIRNRNEKRVLTILLEALEESHHELSPKDVQDVYACALNLLPARYAHEGTIILRDPVKKEDVQTAVRTAIERILENPKE